jgi:hypothetical protein
MEKRFLKRWIINLALFIVIVLLAILAWLDQPPPPASKPLLGNYLPGEVSSLSILRQGRQAIRLEKDEQSWRMLSPYATQADTARINSLLAMYSLEISTELESSQIQLDQFGLKEPALQVVFNEQSLSFGDTQPVDKRRYVMTNGRVFLVADSNFQLLNSSSTSYIDRHLIPKTATPSKIMIGDRIIEKTAQGWIDSKQPETELVNELLRQWKKAKANWITVAEAGMPEGTPVSVTLSEQQGLVQYIAQKRASGIVLVHADLGLEYHLLHSAVAQLGLAVDDQSAAR